MFLAQRTQTGFLQSKVMLLAADQELEVKVKDTLANLSTSSPMQNLGRVRQETRSGPGPLMIKLTIGDLCIRQVINCLEAVPTRAGHPSTMLKEPVSSQAINQIFN